MDIASRPVLTQSLNVPRVEGRIFNQGCVYYGETLLSVAGSDLKLVNSEHCNSRSVNYVKSLFAKCAKSRIELWVTLRGCIKDAHP